MELVDTSDLKSEVARRAGSSPAWGTNIRKKLMKKYLFEYLPAPRALLFITDGLLTMKYLEDYLVTHKNIDLLCMVMWGICTVITAIQPGTGLYAYNIKPRQEEKPPQL